MTNGSSQHQVPSTKGIPIPDSPFRPSRGRLCAPALEVACEMKRGSVIAMSVLFSLAALAARLAPPLVAAESQGPVDRSKLEPDAVAPPRKTSSPNKPFSIQHQDQMPGWSGPAESGSFLWAFAASILASLAPSSEPIIQATLPGGIIRIQPNGRRRHCSA